MNRAFAALFSAAALSSLGAVAHAQRAEPQQEASTRREPLVLDPISVTATSIDRWRVEEPPIIESSSFMPADEQREHVLARRGTRVLIGTLAGLGTLALSGGITALGVIAPLLACGSSFGCAGGQVGAISLGVLLGVGSTFAVPAGYVFGAARYGVQGSYWATFGGFWGGVGVGTLITTLAAAVAARSTAAITIMFTIAALMPSLGMALAFEYTAEVTPQVRQRRNARSAPIALPSLLATHNALGISWSGAF